MSSEVFINVAPGETRLALVEDGRLVDFVTHRAGAESLVGAVYVGRVAQVSKAQGSVFVDIGRARPGLLALSDVPRDARPPAEGDAVVVEVVRDAADDKGPKLVGRVAPVLPDVRAPALVAAAPDPIAHFLRTRATPGWRVVADDRRLHVAGVEIGLHAERAPIFAAHDIEHQLEQALQPLVVFGDGASLIIEETAALTAIDVNTGPRAAPLAVNLAAIPEIARHVRLRNLAGQILVDLLPMKAREQKAKVLDALRAATAADPCPVHVLGLTRLGLAELTRRRQGESLATRLGVSRALRRSPATAALELLRRIDEQARFGGTRRFAPVLSPAIQAALDGPYRAVLDELTRRHALALAPSVDPGLAAEDYRL